MSVNVTNCNSVALASLTSANGTARNGTTFATNTADPGTLLVLCSASITTSSVLATFKLQVSANNSTWYDLAGVSTATEAGTGSPVTTTRALYFPIAAHAIKSIRVVATLSGAATAGADVTSASYQYVPFGGLFSKSVPT
jgi:hypothetical protein